MDQLRPAGQVGVEPLNAAVVEGQNVVLGGLDEEQPLEVGEAVRLVGREIVRLRPVIRAVELPDVVVVRRQLAVITHGVEWRVIAVQPWW